jgi:hypothetical protein
MSDNVIPLNTITRLDIPVDRVLEAASEVLESVVVIGWDNNEEFYFASSIADGPDVLWLLEHAKKGLLSDE